MARPKYIAVCERCGEPFQRIERTQRYCSHACVNPSREERFWDKVDRSGGPDACWVFTASRYKDGYGNFGGERAHRVAWQLLRGPIPPGMLACHNCPDGDNPICVNPAHLFLGTVQDNHRDMVNKGRHPRGERTGAAKIDDAAVRAIRSRAANGEVQRQIAHDFGISPAAVCLIVGRRTWRHVP